MQSGRDQFDDVGFVGEELEALAFSRLAQNRDTTIFFGEFSDVALDLAKELGF